MNEFSEQVCQEIVQTCLNLTKSKLVEGLWGNVSARLDDNLVAITPSGRDYQSLAWQDISIIDLKGNIQKSIHNPSSEAFLHLAIYNNRSDVKAVIHTHSVYASAFAVAEKPIMSLIEDVVQIVGGEIAVAPYALPGTQELAKNAVEYLQDKNAVLLSKHGTVACGRSLAEAFVVASIVEKTAQIALFAGILNPNVKPLSNHDIEVLRTNYLEKYSKQQLVED